MYKRSYPVRSDSKLSTRVLFKVPFMFENSKYMVKIAHVLPFDRFSNALLDVNVYGFWRYVVYLRV